MNGKFKKIIKGAVLVLVLAAIILPLVFFTGSSPAAADTTIVSPSTAAIASDSGLSCTDTAVWTNQNNAMAQDDTPAYISDNNLDSNNISQKLSLSNFGVSLPAGSTVDGIVVRIDKYKTQGSVVDSVVRLTKTAGTAVGDNKADTTTAWAASDTDTYKTYGGATDKWGTTWSEAEVESTGFGVVICAKATGNNSRPAIDHVEITVYYTPPISVDLSGTAYQSEGGLVLTSRTLKIYKNGSTLLASPTTNASDGTWSATGLNIVSGDIVNVYIDGDTSFKGNTVFVSDGNDQTNIDIYGGVLAVRHDSGSNITNVNLSTGRVSGDASDMMYAISGSTLTATSSAEIHIWTGDTFAPGGIVKTQGTGGLHLDENSVTNLDTQDNIISGNINIDAGATLTLSNDTSLGGNLTNNGTFNHSAGTLNLIDSLITSTISSVSDISFATLKSSAAGKNIKFQKQTTGSPKFTVAGQFNFQGISGNPIIVSSDTAGSQWNIYFNSSQNNINYVRFTDSGCAAGTALVTGNTSILDGGNNGACWSFIDRSATTDSVGDVDSGGGVLKTGGGKNAPVTGVTIQEGGGELEIGGSVAPPTVISP